MARALSALIYNSVLGTIGTGGFLAALLLLDVLKPRIPNNSRTAVP